MKTGLVRLVAATDLLRDGSIVRRGARFLAAPGEARQLVEFGTATRDDDADPRAVEPWRVPTRE